MVGAHPNPSPNPNANPHPHPHPHPHLDPDPKPNPNPDQVGAEGEIVGKRMKDGNVYAAGPQRYTGKVVANSTVMTPDGVVKGVLNGANVPAFEVTA